MKNFGVKITYLYNSGFIIETTQHLLLFDYYKEDANEKGQRGLIPKQLLNNEKKVIIFASHGHVDHFNPVILEWMNNRTDLNYVLSDDIKPGRIDERVKLIAPYEQLKIGELNMKSYGSTDQGVSFLVNVDGLTIFHAGDLNWWYWWDDTKEEMEKAEHWFKKEIDKIKDEKINLAFFPVDPRLEHNYKVGGEYFVQQLHPEVLIPMHFGTEFEITNKFAELMKETDTRVIKLNSSPQEIIL